MFRLAVVVLLVAGSAGAATLKPRLALSLAGLDSPEAGSPVDVRLNFLVEAQGHPETITVTAIRPNTPPAVVALCSDVPTCAGDVLLDQCGTWTIEALVEYAHEDPAYPGYPYVLAEAIPVVVDQCEIFADGFESGNLTNWTARPKE
jgi:hypothetical protein